MPLKGLECPVSKLIINSDTCPRPTTDRRRVAAAAVVAAVGEARRGRGRVASRCPGERRREVVAPAVRKPPVDTRRRALAHGARGGQRGAGQGGAGSSARAIVCAIKGGANLRVVAVQVLAENTDL
jgi:hypothetical protein